MPTRKPIGFSLVEMMVVLTIIIVILLILIPTFELAQRSAWMSSCASNLRQIYIAHQQKAGEIYQDKSGRRLEKIEGWTWPKTLLPYLDNDAHVLICPEDGDPAGAADFNGLKLALHETSRSPINFNHADFTQALDYVDLSVDVRWVRQLSGEQLSQVESYIGGTYSGYVGNVGSRLRAYWTPDRYAGYEPGANPNLFYLLVEPDAVAAGELGWVNFADFMIKVERLPNGDLRVTPMHGVTQSKTAGWLVNAAGQEALTPPGVLQPNETRSLILPGKRSSYGMNDQALWQTMATGANKIVAMDYEDVIVDVTTWHDWDDAQGNPLYGRHPSGHKVNALFLNGAIHQVAPQQITPELPTLEQIYWNL